jgi:hypothetical protein
VIEQWLSGADRAGFDSFVAALADEFEIVTPDGETVRKPELVEGFGAAFGAAPGVKIEVRGARVLAETDELVVVHYEDGRSRAAEPACRPRVRPDRHRSGGPDRAYETRLH